MDNLNDYQAMFLAKLAAAGVLYLIVGGQSRHAFDGDYDLDIWIDDSSAGNREAARKVLLAWLDEHPMHWAPGQRVALVTQHLVNLQLPTLPDAEVYYSRSGGEPAPIGPAQGIDVLFGGNSTSEPFASFAYRAEHRESSGIMVAVMSATDSANLMRLGKAS